MSMANHTKGRPHLIGNPGRPGKGRPIGSGRPKIFTDPVSLTIRIEKADKLQWEAEAIFAKMSLGEYIRAVMSDVTF